MHSEPHFGDIAIERGVILAPYTTYKIGGPAEYFTVARTSEDVVKAVTAARAAGIPFFILGLGANVLIGDGGIKGLTILNRSDAISFDGTAATAGSGAVMKDLINQSAERGLSGLEHFAGIPSSVGGALWQNLHFLSPDRERTVYIAEVLESAKVLNEAGAVIEVGPEFFDFGYDESVLRDNPQLIALEATFRLAPEDTAILKERIAANLEWRSARHPDIIEFPSCGSVFKKIEGVGAGRLIEQAGMKGHRLGGAQVSEKHANFFVNRGGATAADVKALIALVQEKVAEATGYHLEPEINFVGEN